MFRIFLIQLSDRPDSQLMYLHVVRHGQHEQNRLRNISWLKNRFQPQRG